MRGIELLEEGNDELAALDLDTVDDGDLTGLLVAVHGVEARLVANKARLMGEVDARRVHADDGSKTAAA